MELKNIILPIGVLVVALVVLGAVTLFLTWDLNDKVAKLADTNSLAITLSNEKIILLADNLEVKTKYNALLANFNTTSAALSAEQARIILLDNNISVLTSKKNDLNAQVIKDAVDLNKIGFDYNKLLLDTNQIRTDYNKLVIDNNMLGNLVVDRNQLLFTTNDYNVRAHRLYIYANNCYWAVKCTDTNNTICALKYGYTDIDTVGHSPTVSIEVGIPFRNTCKSAIDSNVGDYNYFS